jgi:hypothetical protein
MIAQTLTTSFKTQLLTATHNFTASTGDTFKMALYLSTASLGESTTVYTATGEITDTGYSAGGIALTAVTPTSSGTTAFTSFSAATFTSVVSTVIAGALIYNSSKSNKSVAVLDFGGLKTSSVATPLVITFPTASATTAIIRLP